MVDVHVPTSDELVRNGAVALIFAAVARSPLAADLISRAYASYALRRALTNAGFVAKTGEEAHHMVAFKDERASAARAILKKFGIGINDAENGVFLPASKEEAKLVGSAAHRGCILMHIIRL
jgi:hypothetical protein